MKAFSETYLGQRLRKVRNLFFDRFFFIHINKTGGSSIEKALKLPFEHKTALEKIEEAGRKRWDRAFTFAMVRNPWDKVVSHYKYRTQTNQTEMGKRELSFADWVRLAYLEKDPEYHDIPRMFMPQTDWLVDQDGKIVVDFIGKFEAFAEDFQSVCEKIGKSASLPHVKASKRGPYPDYYDDKTREIVGQCFESDIENFGYSF